MIVAPHSFSPDLHRPGLTPGVSTYRAVQICGTTSVARAHQFDDLFLTVGRQGEQLDLPGHGDMKLVAGLANAEDGLPAHKPAKLAAGGQALQFDPVKIAEQGQHRQVARQIEGSDVQGRLLQMRRRSSPALLRVSPCRVPTRCPCG